MDPLTTRLTRAAVWTGGNTLMVREVPIPELGDGDVLVRVDLATVCGSDLHTVSGRRAGACPSVLGHEAVGVIEDTNVRASRSRADVPVEGVVQGGRLLRHQAGRRGDRW